MALDYVDFFLFPVKKRKLGAYKKMANEFGRFAKKHGVVAYREALGDDLKPKGSPSFVSLLKPKKDEVLVGSFVVHKSRAHRLAFNKAMMDDPGMKKYATMEMPFDMKKMYYGGFKSFVKL